MAELLAMQELSAGYGEAVVLDKVSLSLQEGDSLAILGRNGVGKTTLLTTLMGITQVHSGSTAVARPGGPWHVARVYQTFPRLEERRNNMGNQLSGGEQQMLAIARALMLNPSLLLLDEPMEGLAPIIVQEVMETIRRLVTESGMAVMLAEQHAQLALSLTKNAIVLDRGRIVHASDSASLLSDPATLQRLVAIA